MLPIGDYAGKRHRFPVVNYLLIAANLLVFIYQLTLPQSELERFVFQWGAVPVEIMRGTDSEPLVPVPIYLTLLSSIFMHGGLLHFGGNMLYLWVFGDNVESAFGHLRYLLFYVICGIGAALVQIGINTGSAVPMVGASGAIAGVMGAYIVMFPSATVRTLIFLGIFFTFTYLPALLVIGVWFILQLISGIGSLGVPTQQTGGVAFWAHIGGFVIGALLVFLFRQRDYQTSSPHTFGGYGR